MGILEDFQTENKFAVIIANQNGTIIYVNSKFEEIFFWSYKEIIGKPLTKIIPPNYRDAHNLGFSRFLGTENPTILDTPLNLKAINKKNEIFLAEHRIKSAKVNSEWFFAATIVPLETIS